MVRLVVLYWTVQTMMRPFVAPYALSLGAGTTLVGATLAASAIPAAILCIPIGLYCDRLGSRAVVTAGALSSAVGAAAMALAPNVGVLLASQLLVGIGQMAMWLAIQGMMVGERDSGESRIVRARRVVNYSSFGFVGQLVGPLLGGYLVQWWGYSTAFGVAAGLSALSFGGMVGSGRQLGLADDTPLRDRPSRWIPLREAVASYRIGFGMLGNRGVSTTMAVSFCALLLLDVRVSLQPLYFHSIAIESSWVGWILVTGTVFSFLSRNLLMAIVGRVRDGTLIALMLGASGVSIAAVVLTHSLVVILILAAVGGTAIGMVQPLTILLTAEHTPRTGTGVGLGLRILANRSAQAADPVLFAGLTPLVGLAPAIGAISLLAGAVGLLSGTLLNRAPPGEPPS
jgi:MFS family permease